MKRYTTTYLIDGELVKFTSDTEAAAQHMEAALEWGKRVYPDRNLFQSYVEGRFEPLDDEGAPGG